ncbi:tyrosine-type recombinase/integrase [uncultured Flavobacterium sp.]|uniref:tyrosine-type recombinase/integrase n=1 Tax=uncultured Flavobacterium sp. TaxID=165435 RepID=UPI0025DEB6B6|nr:tyrosine-type recombinase/integrase [uncultured Flavobacterium sp.]
MEKKLLETYLKENLAEKTALSYLYTINHFLKVNTKAKRFKYQDILDYMNEVGKMHSNTDYQVRILSAIKKYYDYLVMCGDRTDHPCRQLTIKKINNRMIQVQDLFSTEELQMLLGRENRYQHLDFRNQVLISLLIYQGLSSQELVNLRVQDIDLDAATVYIKGSANQNKRTMELMNKQMIIFSKYINEVRPQLLKGTSSALLLGKLGRPISVDGIHAVLESLKMLFPDRKLNPKTIRMSVICNWLNEKKMSLEKTQELAGHKWPGTTEKYIKVNNLQQREMINKFFPIN